MSAARDSRSGGPHQALAVDNRRDAFACELFDQLWDRYRQRVAHVQTYERLVREAGATFVNDHIAFRTFAWQQPPAGISTLSRLFEALGYQPAGVYHFADKHLNAVHFQHPHPEFPKLFISELKTWELSPRGQEIVGRSLAQHRPAVSRQTLHALASRTGDANRPADAALMAEAVRQFDELPWPPPNRDDVLAVNQESQYAAWVLVHGYAVNHFTSLVNSHQAAALDDIEKTAAALRAAGVPMKDQIEGARGSKLRQTATAAVVIDVPVTIAGAAASMPWTYAYFELAERNLVTDPESGRQIRFQGFLGPQATQLFEMTRVDDKPA